MDKCRLVFIHHRSLLTTTIIIFAIFWIHHVSSASVRSNNDISHNLSTTEKILLGSSLRSSLASSSSSSFTGTSAAGAGALAAAASSVATFGITTESFCSHQTELYFQKKGKRSSLIFELKPNSIEHQHDQCRRYLTAPESHGFFIRLIRSPKIKKLHNQSNTSGWRRNFHGAKSHESTNLSYSCPLSITSEDDPLKMEWKIDPCQIEINNDNTEPVRLLPGHLKIIWEHRNHNPSSFLMITLLGKGETCQKNDEVHPCLKLGGEALLCISKDLICDGIHHCPKGSEYDSDEDDEMCTKYQKNIYGDYDSEAWEHLTIEIFRNLFNTEHTIIPSTSSASTPTKIKDNNGGIDKKKSTTHHNSQIHRNTTHSSITGDLSKYGPWGYLMLGMLLCGAALLICGLWECCCRQNKSEDTTAGDSSGSLDSTNADVLSMNDTQNDIHPPNYDDLDPPPPYSVLFPNQKLLDDGSSSRTQMLPQSQTTQSAPLEILQRSETHRLETSAQITVTPSAPSETQQTPDQLTNSTTITPINNESFDNNGSSNNTVNYNDLESG